MKVLHVFNSLPQRQSVIPYSLYRCVFTDENLCQSGIFNIFHTFLRLKVTSEQIREN